MTVGELKKALDFPDDYTVVVDKCNISVAPIGSSITEYRFDSDDVRVSTVTHTVRIGIHD